MGLTELIGDPTEVFNVGWPLMEHAAGVKADGVHQKVGVEVLCIQVSCDKHLAVGPGLRSEFPGELMGFLGCDAFFGGEGLDIVVEPHGALLVISLPGQKEFQVREKGIAILTAEEESALFFLIGLVLPADVVSHTAESTGRLLCVSDLADGCHQRFSMAATSARAS